MSDLPPPYTALTRHPMLPRTSHDESARFNFLTHLNRYLSGTLGPGNRLAYDTRVLPAFRAEHGRDPEHRYEIRDAMNQDPFHRMWSALKRNSMEMRQHNGRQTVLRQLDELDARMKRGVKQSITTSRQKLETLAASLSALSPLAVLERGYSLTKTLAGGDLVRNAGQLRQGDRISTLLAQGSVVSEVVSVELDDE